MKIIGKFVGQGKILNIFESEIFRK